MIFEMERARYASLKIKKCYEVDIDMCRRKASAFSANSEASTLGLPTSSSIVAGGLTAPLDHAAARRPPHHLHVLPPSLPSTPPASAAPCLVHRRGGDALRPQSAGRARPGAAPRPGARRRPPSRRPHRPRGARAHARGAAADRAAAPRGPRPRLRHPGPAQGHQRAASPEAGDAGPPARRPRRRRGGGAPGPRGGARGRGAGAGAGARAALLRPHVRQGGRARHGPDGWVRDGGPRCRGAAGVRLRAEPPRAAGAAGVQLRAAGRADSAGCGCGLSLRASLACPPTRWHGLLLCCGSVAYTSFVVSFFHPNSFAPAAAYLRLMPCEDVGSKALHLCVQVNPQLKGHLKGALNNGATVEEVRAVRETAIRVCEAAGMTGLSQDSQGGWGWRGEVANL